MGSVQKNIKLTVISLLAFIFLVLGVFVYAKVNLHNSSAENFSGTLLNQERELSDFSFTATNGEKFNKQTLLGHWSLVFFGFTNCPMLCPTTMGKLAKFYNKLKTDSVYNLPQVIMVSIDPARDSLNKLRSYVHGFDRDFVGLKGSEETVKAIADELGIVYMKVNQDKKFYDMTHSGTVILINPAGNIKAFFTEPDAIAMAKDYEMLTS